MATKWYPDRPLWQSADDFIHTTTWYCSRCHGNGKYYKHAPLKGYPFFELEDPCAQCEGEGFRTIKTVQVKKGLL